MLAQEILHDKFRLNRIQCQDPIVRTAKIFGAIIEIQKNIFEQTKIRGISYWDHIN